MSLYNPFMLMCGRDICSYAYGYEYTSINRLLLYQGGITLVISMGIPGYMHDSREH